MPQTATIEPNVDMMKMHHIMPHFVEEKPLNREATPEELENLRQAREEYARGEYYAQLPGETMRDFAERIIADPEKWLACNLNKES